jgi:hypothetical protein
VGQGYLLERRSAAFVEEQVDKSWYRRAEGADDAACHSEKRDGAPRIPSGASQTNQIAGERKNPKTYRKDIGWRTELSSLPGRSATDFRNEKPD